MIRTEITVVAALFGAGLGAGVLASFLLALGRGSRVARAVTDALAPLAAGIVFFFALKGVADGVFRLYSVLAFLLGGVAARWLVGRLSPCLSRGIERAKVPIKSLESKIEERLNRLLAPLREKRAAKKALRAEKNAALRLQKEKMRTQKDRERNKKAKARAQKRRERKKPSRERCAERVTL